MNEETISADSSWISGGPFSSMEETPVSADTSAQSFSDGKDGKGK